MFFCFFSYCMFLIMCTIHQFKILPQVLFPLQFTGMLGQVDVEAQVEGGGSSGQSGAIRYALSRALQAFVDKDIVENMRLGEYVSVYCTV